MSDNESTDWDEAAAHFDTEPDHGLTDPAVRAAWASLLLRALPRSPSVIADVGCGTGSLSVLLAAQGHRVCGVDAAPRMVDRARDKTRVLGLTASFVLGDAAHPPLREASFDAVLCRHVLWALPHPRDVLGRWAGLLRPGGRLLLVEGRWTTGAGITGMDLVGMLRSLGRTASMTVLADPAYWGRAITDERYVVVSPAVAPA